MGHFLSLSGAPKIRLSGAAAFYSLFLSGLFVAVYGGCNTLSSHRTDVGIWVWSWDYMIPFVTIMTLPYLSIDLFFGVAPFICQDRHERRLMAARIAFGILAAGMFYLLFPLKLAIQRVHPEGWLGVPFNLFLSADRPYNLLPSLHITLRTILADTYARNTAGVWKWASHAWFSLIGFSTVLTHQHHLVDIVGGFVMATLCFYVLDPVGWVASLTPNPRIGFCYAAGGLLLGLLAPGAGPAWFLIVWCGISMAVVAGGYFVWGPAIFRKRNGTLALSARLLLAPVLIGQRLSLAYYSRQCRPWDRVTDSLWIGRVLNKREARTAIHEGLTAVLDLTGEFSECRALRSLAYLNVPVLDLTAPTPAQLEQAVAFVREHTRRGPVLVHCKIGYSRSAAVVAACLLAERIDNGVADALHRIRTVRPTVVIRPEALAAIRQYAAGRQPA